MFEYFAVSISLVLISSIALSFFLSRKKLLKNNTAKAIIIGTVSVIFLSAFFPFLTGYLMNFTVKLNSSVSFEFGVGFSVVLTLLMYIGVLLLISVIVADLLMGNKETIDIKSIKKHLKLSLTNVINVFMYGISGNKDNLGRLEVAGALENQNIDNIYSEESENHVSEMDEIYTEVSNNDHPTRTIPESITDYKEETDHAINFQDADFQGAVAQNENMLQKPVDRVQNTDTIGLATDCIVTKDTESPNSGAQEELRAVDKHEDTECLLDDQIDKSDDLADISNQSIEELNPEGEDEMETIDRNNLMGSVLETHSKAIELNCDAADYFESNEDYFDEDTLGDFTGGVGEIKDNAQLDEIVQKSVVDLEEDVQDRFEDINIGNNICNNIGNNIDNDDNTTAVDKDNNNEDSGLADENVMDSEQPTQEELIDEADNEIVETVKSVDTVHYKDENTGKIFGVEQDNHEKPEDVNVLIEETIIENNKVDQKIGILDEYINEAFNLKASGDFEGAIVNYMYALEQKPEDDLVFWLVLDICTLYKQLGKVDLAKNILEGYISEYGRIMNKDVKAEIEKNLLNN
jgi:hypothetical protein